MPNRKPKSMPMFPLAAAAFVVALPVAALAGPGQGKAGLWETTVKMDLGAVMPALTPEQAATMKQMGIAIPTAGGSAITSKVCVTPEQAARGMVAPPTEAGDGCRTSEPVANGSTLTATVRCDGEMQGEGAVTVTYDGDSAYKGSFALKGRAEGQVVDVKSEFEGKWLSADCGAVKPILE